MQFHYPIVEYKDAKSETPDEDLSKDFKNEKLKKMFKQMMQKSSGLK